MLGAEGFKAYITKHQKTSNNERLELIIDEILESGRIQKDDLTILVVDEKI
jgi:sigma-B regulation protein RsbU (phosphoserine phosphatase)